MAIRAAPLTRRAWILAICDRCRGNELREAIDDADGLNDLLLCAFDVLGVTRSRGGEVGVAEDRDRVEQHDEPVTDLSD